MTDINTMKGLTTEEAERRQKEYGKNELPLREKESILKTALKVLKEPMFLLLFAAAAIYFLLGEPRDGAVMLIFVAGIIGTDIIQEIKTDRTINALKDLSAPRVTVMRDGREQEIASVDIVPGDVMFICEGVKIPADGTIIECADLCVDESSMTGEADGVWKTARHDDSGDHWRRDYCYAGTLVTKGTAAVRVEQIAAGTEYGKIGRGIAAAPAAPAPLQKQTDSLVKVSSVIAGIFFVLVCVLTWLNLAGEALRARFVNSILSGVTLAMAMIPEEFPVILTVFLSMGAWRLAKKDSLVRRLPSVETLGAVSVLCVDKTGTITMNQMTLQKSWAANGSERELMETMGLGCETNAYDPMEKAMLACCGEHGITKEYLFGGELVREYAFTDELKMMGHVWRRNGGLVIAAKGSPEKVFTLCGLTDSEREDASRRAAEMSADGLRVIAVARGSAADAAAVPESLTCCRLTLLGLVGLADPPRSGVKEDIAVCGRAGIRVVMITGDNGDTAAAIAKKVGIPYRRVLTGAMLDSMSDEELRSAVKDVSIFSRVIPEHKMRIVKAFKENGEIVAMTGDGVNDAPALKYADIGIAMGRRGSEVSREAADLILMDDNFTTIVETVRDGRRIYDNIRRAVGYVFTIHIPIAFASLLGPLLGIAPSALLLLPIHVVLLEIIIDPTCSIVLERQPAEDDVMERPPRDPNSRLLDGGLLFRSVAQGVMVFAASFGIYYFTLRENPAAAQTARAMGLAVIMLANLFLVHVNSSDSDSAFHSMTHLAHDWVMWIVDVLTFALMWVTIYSPLSGWLKLARLSARQLGATLLLSAAAVLWYEIVKFLKRKNEK